MFHDRQDPTRPSVGQGIMHEIHPPAFGRPGRDRCRPTMQCHVFPSEDPHAQLQPIQSVQSLDALSIHPPAFPTQQHPDPQIPKPGPGMSPIANAHPQRELILRAAAAIPGGATELGQPTGPRTTHLRRPVEPWGQFPAASGPQTFSRRPPTAWNFRVKDPPPIV